MDRIRHRAIIGAFTGFSRRGCVSETCSGRPFSVRLLLQCFAPVLLCLSTLLPAQSIAPVVTTAVAPNSAKAERAPYVILVSLDAFRYDYLQKYGAPNLQRLASGGATAPDGMIPSYPSLTFPNHYTLVTGLLPEHSGMVANGYYDATRNQQYSMSKTSGDGTWYRGVPLWSLAEKQGMRAASFFWPTSDAEIAGERPAYYVPFDDTLDEHKRIQQVLAWLALPPAQRPHLITLYYSNVDHAGHNFGPDAPETRDAVHHVDDLIGELKQGLDATGLPIDLVVVADHGMVRVDPEPVILDRYADLSKFRTVGSLLYAPDEATAEAAYMQFRAHSDPRFTAYRRRDVPARLSYNADPREGDPVIVANGPYTIRAHPRTQGKEEVGEHGFDPAVVPQMKALFIASGPGVRQATLPSFQNTDVYDFICALLRLKPVANDGRLAPLKAALRHK